LIAEAMALTPMPIHGLFHRRQGCCQARHTSPMIRIAATQISTPSSTAEKYSALWWPCWWSASAGMWLTRIAQKAQRGGDDVDDRFQRVRIERDRTGHPPGIGFSPSTRSAMTIDQAARRVVWGS
jgi:hypothetical protein